MVLKKVLNFNTYIWLKKKLIKFQSKWSFIIEDVTLGIRDSTPNKPVLRKIIFMRNS